jgi:hypothetical protein
MIWRRDLDPKNMGGADHHTPLFRTPLFCNEEVDFQDAGSWGALSSWEDSSGAAGFSRPSGTHAFDGIMDRPGHHRFHR